MHRFLLLGAGLAFALGLSACGKDESVADGAAGGSGGTSLGGEGGGDSNWERICRSQSIAACASIAGCSLLEARRIDPGLECVEETQEVVGCGPIGCGAALTTAEDEEGNAWQFPSTCLAEGFTAKHLGSFSECDGLGGAGGVGGVTP